MYGYSIWLANLLLLHYQLATTGDSLRPEGPLLPCSEKLDSVGKGRLTSRVKLHSFDDMAVRVRLHKIPGTDGTRRGSILIERATVECVSTRIPFVANAQFSS
jgi:hypothetical protein